LGLTLGALGGAATLALLASLLFAAPKLDVQAAGLQSSSAAARPPDEAISGTGAGPQAIANAGAWAARAPLPIAVTQAGGAAANGKVYVVGGQNANGADVANVSVFDPGLNAWSSLPPMPIGPRYQGSTVAVGQRLYVLGGWQSSTGLPSTTVAIHDTVSGQWTVGSPLPARSGCSAADAIGSVIYLYSACDGYNGYRNNFFAYDTVANSWSTQASPPNYHSYGGAAAVNGHLYLVGGNDAGGTASAAIDMFTPGTGWSANPPQAAPTARTGMATVALGSVVYVIGGASATVAKLTTVEAFDTNAGSWSSMPALPSPLTTPAGASLNGLVYVAGGTDAVTDAVNVFTPGSVTPPSAPTSVSASLQRGIPVITWERRRATAARPCPRIRPRRLRAAWR